MTDSTAGGTGPGNGLASLASDLYQALEAGDRGRLAELLHPGFEGRVTEGLPLGLGGEYHGPEAMRRGFWGRIGLSFAIRAVPAEFCPLPDGRLMVTGRYEGTAREGGPLSAEFVHFLSFADGRIAGLVQLTDSVQWAQALAAGAAAGPGTAADTGTEAGQPHPREPATVEFSVTDGLGVIRLNRPGARNAIDQALVDDLREAVQRCAADAAVRALLICASGPSFTVGGDIAMLAAAGPGELPAELRRMTASYHATLQILDRLEVPVVAAVHGAVAGGGLGLTFVADIVIAAAGTRFATGFSGLGLSGDGGGTWFLPRLVGMRRAAELYFGQRVLDADEAAAWGLVSRVVPAADLAAEAERTARSLAAGPTRAFGEIRTLLRRTHEASLGDQLQAETAALSRTAGTRDAAHAIDRFMTQSRPEFLGC
ncbi:MAG: enoyl-CoA hydratase-related protein [Actinomycetota bacterium]|nr:enoyl-CoA hydratase-related protein [Actinomycetota bacterium]